MSTTMNCIQCGTEIKIQPKQVKVKCRKCGTKMEWVEQVKT